MEEAEYSADRAESESYGLEEDEDLKELIREITAKIQEAYEKTECEDYEDKLQEIDTAIIYKEDEEREQEEILVLAEEEAHPWKDLATDYRTKGWQALIAELTTEESNDQNGEQGEWLTVAIEIIEEVIADTPDETPAEAEARMAEEDKEQQVTEQVTEQATEQANTYEPDAADIYQEKFNELTWWIINDWNGSRKDNNDLLQKKTEVLLWSKAADSIEVAEDTAIAILNDPEREGEEYEAAREVLKELRELSK